MRAESILTVFFLALFSRSGAQPLSYVPDVAAGHRSFTYLHHVNYHFSDKLKVNNLTLFGSFLTVSAQYRKVSPAGSFGYSIGMTYQKGFTLEQALSLEYVPCLFRNIQAYFSMLAIANINLEEYQRGLQFMWLGIKEKLTCYGLAIHLDQFNNSRKTLENIGLFMKRSF